MTSAGSRDGAGVSCVKKYLVNMCTGSGMAPGLYSAELDVLSNDPDTPILRMPLQLTVK